MLHFSKQTVDKDKRQRETETEAKRERDNETKRGVLYISTSKQVLRVV